MKVFKRLIRKLKSKISDAFYPYGYSTNSFIPSMCIEQFLKEKERILIIGDYTLRDYKVLKERRKDIYLIDIVVPKQETLINGVFVKQSVEDPLPFENEFFDGVVMAEVIEHLFLDVNALKEIRRVLKNDGILAITVPYFHDKPEYHVRMHSFNTIRRLLEYSGFKIDYHFYRGLFHYLPNSNRLFFTIYMSLLLILTYLKCTDIFRHLVVNAEVFFGERLPFIQRITPSYGGIIKATKSEPKNFLILQKKVFGNGN